MSEFSCEQCQQHLFELIEDQLNPLEKQRVQQHIDQCSNCTQQLADIWQMQAAASRWKEQTVPYWPRRKTFFAIQWTPALQWVSSFASVFVLILVIGQAQVDTQKGFSIRFGGNYVDQPDLERRLSVLETTQREQLEQELRRVSNQQLASNQLMLRTLLETSRRERNEDLQSVVSLLDVAQDEQQEQTNESLRYLIASQVEDKRNIEQLTRALLRSNAEGSNL